MDDGFDVAEQQKGEDERRDNGEDCAGHALDASPDEGVAGGRCGD
jgi:hypothetical protein